MTTENSTEPKPGPPCAWPGCNRAPERHVREWSTATHYRPGERVTDHYYTNTAPPETPRQR